MVIRSENGDDTTAAPSERHVMPPRASPMLAEQHGLLDADAAGHPVRPDLYAVLAQRDAARLEDLPAAHRESGPDADSWYFDTDSLDVPYLPDPLARQFLVRGLPGTTTTLTADALGTWPQSRSFRLRVVRAATASGWVWAAARSNCASPPDTSTRCSSHRSSPPATSRPWAYGSGSKTG